MIVAELVGYLTLISYSLGPVYLPSVPFTLLSILDESLWTVASSLTLLSGREATVKSTDMIYNMCILE